MLLKVKQYIKFIVMKDNFEQATTTSENISQRNLTKYAYYNCLPTSSDSDYQSHLKWQLYMCICF